MAFSVEVQSSPSRPTCETNQHDSSYHKHSNYYEQIPTEVRIKLEQIRKSIRNNIDDPGAAYWNIIRQYNAAEVVVHCAHKDTGACKSENFADNQQSESSDRNTSEIKQESPEELPEQYQQNRNQQNRNQQKNTLFTKLASELVSSDSEFIPQERFSKTEQESIDNRINRETREIVYDEGKVPPPKAIYDVDFDGWHSVDRCRLVLHGYGANEWSNAYCYS